MEPDFDTAATALKRDPDGTGRSTESYSDGDLVHTPKVTKESSPTKVAGEQVPGDAWLEARARHWKEHEEALIEQEKYILERMWKAEKE